MKNPYLFLLCLCSCGTPNPRTASPHNPIKPTKDTVTVLAHTVSSITPKVGRSLEENYHAINLKPKRSRFNAVKTMHYTELVAGYRVTIKALPKNEISCSARITFHSPNNSFTVQCRDYFDWALFEHTNDSLWDTTPKTMELAYHHPKAAYRPFFFKDIDFDGVDELIVNGYDQAPRGCSLWQIYKIGKNRAYPMRQTPFDAMTELTMFDYSKQTICVYDDGGRYFTVERWRKQQNGTFLLEFQLDRVNFPRIKVFSLPGIEVKKEILFDTTVVVVYDSLALH